MFRIFRQIIPTKSISIFRIVTRAPPAEYAFYCLAFGLNRKSQQIYWEYFIYEDEYTGILYMSTYSKYNEDLPKDMWQLYIHRGLL